MRRVRFIVTILAGLLASSALRASDRDLTISRLMDDLQRLQVKIAAGDRAAYTLQPDRLRAIGTAIGAADPEIWKRKSETDALVAYVLGGGQPRDAARLLQQGVIPATEEPFVRGAVAYALGREREAQKLLGPIDPKSLNFRVAGQIAFAQSVLKTGKDPNQAIALLDLARLLAPGGLVEEAALRREIMLTGDRRDPDRVAFLARQYMSRFGRSVYAENFMVELAGNVAKLGLADDLSDVAKFEPLLDVAPPDDRRAFLLTIARAEVLNGKFTAAGEVAREALKETPRDGRDEARGRLYAAASRILTADYDGGVEALKGVEKSRLDGADQLLLAAVAYVAAHLRDEPIPEPPIQGAAAASPIAPPEGKDDDASQSIHLAEAALDRTASLVDPPKGPP